MGRRAHLLPCKFTQEEPTPVAPVRLQGRMTPNGYEPANRAWRPFLTYPTKRTRADGSPRLAGHDPLTLSLDVLTESGHPNRSTRDLVRAYGEGAEGIRSYRDIPAHCDECSSGDASSRRKCAIINCPFWGYRTGRNPHCPRRGKAPVGSRKKVSVGHSATRVAPGHVAG